MEKEELRDGIYIRGTVNGKEIWFTVDTGASRTVLSSQVYKSLDQGPSMPVKGSSCPSEAVRDRLSERGKDDFRLQLGPVAVERELIVADIDDECLLGLDVLQNESGGPADLLLSKGVVKLRGKYISVIQIGLTEAVRKVTARVNDTSTRVSEAVKHVHVESKLYETDVMSDPFCKANDLQEEKCKHVPDILVDLNGGITKESVLFQQFLSTAAICQGTGTAQIEADRLQAASANYGAMCLLDNNASVGILGYIKKDKFIAKVQMEPGEMKHVPSHDHDWHATVYSTGMRKRNRRNELGSNKKPSRPLHVSRAFSETAKEEVEDMQTICKRVNTWMKRRRYIEPTGAAPTTRLHIYESW